MTLRNLVIQLRHEKESSPPVFPHVALCQEAANKIEQLAETLGAALGEHASEAGQFKPDYMPKHWTHTARKLLR
jgi:hypothetical protein